MAIPCLRNWFVEVRYDIREFVSYVDMDSLKGLQTGFDVFGA